MQRFFNALSVSAFVMSGAMVAGAVVAYIRVPSMANKYISEIKLELTEMLTQMIPVEIDGALPELPTSTGPAIPFGQ
jgi:hypothetical protein